MFELWASTPDHMGPAQIAGHARRAEAIGFDGLQVPDAVHDGFVLSTLALAATTRLKVLTGVLVAFPRSPMNVALATWDLAALSGGRFLLGLGSQVKGNIEGRYSTPWTAPVPRMREYVLALRAIFDSFQHGTPLDFQGEHYRFSRLQPFFNPGPLPEGDIPIYLGAVGPLMTALAGDVADGMITHPTNTPPRYVREVILPRLREAAHQRPAPPHLLLNALVATGPDTATIQQQREQYRRLLAFLFSTPAYWPSLALFGWQERGEALRQMTRQGDWDRMPVLLDDAMLDTFVPSGTYDALPALLEEWYGGLSSRLTLALPENPAHDTALARVLENLRKNPSRR